MDTPLRLPDFFVIGVAKCGTTELVALLDRHPSVAMSPVKEPCFFSRDEMHLHTDNFLNHPASWWETFDWDAHFEELLRDYGRLFEGTPEGALCGEATTEYFLSRKAPARIRELAPDARMVVVFREPTRRMMSDYWFHVQHDGRMIFEPEAYFASNHAANRLRWGLYQENLEYWLSHFPREQFHFILFEEYVSPATRQDVLDGLCGFLRIEPVLDAGLGVFSNKTAYPRWLGLELAMNRIRTNRRLPGTAPAWEYKRPHGRRNRLINSVLQTISAWNMTNPRGPAAWPADLVERLQAYYRRENAGLSDLIGRDVEAIWYGPRREEPSPLPDSTLALQ